MSSKYQLLTSAEAYRMKNDTGTVFDHQIPYNDAKLYRLKDSSLLVMPLFSMTKSMWIEDMETLKEFINDEYFPDGNKWSLYYKKNKHYYNALSGHSKNLISDLLDYCEIPEADVIDKECIDKVWEHLKKKRVKDKYRLHFCVLVCRYFIQNNDDYYIDTQILRLSLNPQIQIVLRSKNSQRKFDIEDEVYGKWGYHGINTISIRLGEYF